MEFLDSEVRSLEPPCDRRSERSPFGHRLQPQHVEEIFSQRWAYLLEIGGGCDSRQKPAFQFGGAGGKIASDRLVSGELVGPIRRQESRSKYSASEDHVSYRHEHSLCSQK